MLSPTWPRLSLGSVSTLRHLKVFARLPVTRLALGNESVVHAGPVLPTQHMPKQTTTVKAELLTQKSRTVIVRSPLLCGHLPLEKLRPLAIQLQAWKAILDVSSWVLKTIERGYSLQFACRPHHLRGIIIQIWVHDNYGLVICHPFEPFCKSCWIRVPTLPCSKYMWHPSQRTMLSWLTKSVSRNNLVVKFLRGV